MQSIVQFLQKKNFFFYFRDASDADDDLLGDDAKMPRSAEDSCKK
jgi:hypothetical protein